VRSLLDKLQPREKKLLIVFLIIAGLFGLYSLYGLYQSYQEKLNSDKARLKKSIISLKAMNAKLAKKNIVEHQYKILLKELNERENQFLNRDEKNKFLIDLNQVALNTGVKVLGIQPQKTELEELYIKFPTIVRLQGSYSEIVDYIDQIKQLSYITRIRDLNIELIREGDYLQANIIIVSYALDRKGVEQ